MRRSVVYCHVLKRPVYFDVKEHFRTLHRHVFPLFFALCGIVMVIIIAVQAGKQGGNLPPSDFVGARIGLIQPVEGASFDPALAVLSPTELVLAPEAVVFEAVGDGSAIHPKSERSLEVIAVADGRVVFAATGDEGASVILVHEREGNPVETLYRDLASLRVSVGSQVRRGQALGTVAAGKAVSDVVVHRAFPALASGPVAGEAAGIPEAWRGRADDRLSAPPAGEPIERSALKLEAPMAPKDPES
jgi:hypothetical protein